MTLRQYETSSVLYTSGLEMKHSPKCSLKISCFFFDLCSYSTTEHLSLHSWRSKDTTISRVEKQKTTTVDLMLWLGTREMMVVFVWLILYIGSDSSPVFQWVKFLGFRDSYAAASVDFLSFSFRLLKSPACCSHLHIFIE